MLEERVQSNRARVQLAEAQSKFDAARAKDAEEIARLRDRYERLADSHKKQIKLNQSLEEKVLSVVSLAFFWFSHCDSQSNLSLFSQVQSCEDEKQRFHQRVSATLKSYEEMRIYSKSLEELVVCSPFANSSIYIDSSTLL